MPLSYERFKELAGELAGFDLAGYKSHQMDRRIQSLMTNWNIPDYDEFYRVLQEDPVRFRDFVNKLTINVSEFFRNPDRFELLKERVLPALLSDGRGLKIWSAGCSNGSEPYSVAILLKELAGDRPHFVLGTDIDRQILDRASQGFYNPADVRNVPKDLLDRHFEPEGAGYRLTREIRSQVAFRYHDLLKDPFDTGFDMIICRNVVIYFTEQAKEALYQNFRNSLKNDGWLFVGGTEPLLNCRQIGFEAGVPGFYKKSDIVADVFDYWKQVAATRRKGQE